MKRMLFPKRIYITLLFSAIFLISVCACVQREGGKSTGTLSASSSDEDTSPAPGERLSEPAESVAPADSTALNAIKAVLLGNAEFFETSIGKTLNIDQLTRLLVLTALLQQKRQSLQLLTLIMTVRWRLFFG